MEKNKSICTYNHKRYNNNISSICIKLKNFFLAPENHTDTAKVQVFIITDANRVELTFENPLGTVIALQDTVTANYPLWLCSKAHI